MLMLYSLVVSGISCLVYCLSIALFVNPEMEEYALIIALPFVSFVLINLFAVYRASVPLDHLKANVFESNPLSDNQKKLLNSKHYYLTYGLYPLIIISTILIHMLTMLVEDGSFDFITDPDSWSLLINRGSLFLLVAIIQGSVFDKYISKLKNELGTKATSCESQVSLFKRLSWMLASLALFLGSSIPIFSTMRFDILIDETLPAITLNLADSEDLAIDIPPLVKLMETERELFIDAQQEFDELITHLNEQLSVQDFTDDSAEELEELISDMYDRLPMMEAFEEGMDTQNTVSYVFILLTILAGLIMSFIFSQAYSLQIKLIRKKIAEMLSGNNSVSGRLNITGLDESAELAMDFNRILDYNEEINEELLRADKIKDAFLANVSHELKTSLHGIIGISESLVDGVAGELPAQARRNLQLINSSGRRLTSLVNDILDFSKLREHDIVLILKPLDLKTLSDVVLELSRPLLTTNEVKLVNNIPRDLPAAEADENRLQQVLLNLVGNAIKFTSRGEITVSAQTIGGVIELCVSDTGIGIPADKQVQVFNSFEQADSSISREYGGTGLGLSISRNLIELHGGSLRIESEVGIGTRFFFNLPIATGEKQLFEPHPQPIANCREVIEAEETIVTDIGEGNTVLIVDDEPVNLTVLSNHLSLGNYRVLKASDGEEALALFQQEHPDLVLLDIMMPKMSGFEVCRKIREVTPINRLPIIMLTAKDQAQDLAKGFSSGANDYISKPCTKKELLSRIKTHLELSKINRVYSDFVPSEYLSFLGHDSILDVRLGDNIHREMTIMFADIRSYTTMSESMSPQENFDFINEYLAVMGPCIKKNNGFVNHYLGDGLMALFPNEAEDAVKASIDMSKALKSFNKKLVKQSKEEIKVGIGLHFGKVIFGIIGDVFRKSGNVISDDVNISARLEGLNKSYGSSLIVSQSVLDQLQKSGSTPDSRYLGQVVVKGRRNEVRIYELLEVEESYNRQLKLQTQNDFEKALKQYFAREFGAAADLFRSVLSTNSDDNAAEIYLKHCIDYLMSEPAEDWNGAVVIAEK
jgi:two-component system sensor histidine kinase ChiS|tara:strand:+ start:20096 stop:23230 length:3135 start_codon:yes stop_codon:yes gene_type:complete